MVTLLPWDLVNPVAATTFVKELPDPWADLPETLAFSNILADVQVPSNKARTNQVTHHNYAATFRTWDAESPLGTRALAYSVNEVEFPPISQKLPLSETEMLQLYFANAQGTQPVIDQSLIDAAFDDLATQTEQIKNRMLLAKADVLDDGKFTLAGENGLYLETDYGLVSGQKPTASPLWTNSSATPIDDETAWIVNMTLLGYRRPTRAFTTLAIMQALQKNTQYKIAAYPGVASVTNVGMLTIGQVNSVRAEYGFPTLFVVEHALEDYQGNTVRLVKAGKFILVADGLGDTQWGVTPDSFDLIRAGALTRQTAPGLIGGTYYSPDPLTKWTKVSGCGMPVLQDPRQITIATVG